MPQLQRACPNTGKWRYNRRRFMAEPVCILPDIPTFGNRSMTQRNKLNNIVTRINMLPEIIRSATLTTLFGRTVKFTGTAGIKVEELTQSGAVVSLKNKKSVQNHIGSVHAVASILIAESATGYVVGMNIPDSSVPVIKTIRADYVKRASGDMRAVSSLSPEQIQLMQTQEKGETVVPVTVTDGDGKEPILMEMTWAWTPKKRKA